MKQISFSKHHPEAFIFDEKYVLDIAETVMSISEFDSRDLANQKIEYPEIRKCPKIDIEGIGAAALRGLVDQEHFVVALQSSKLGVVKHNDNFSVAQDGAYWRKIRSVKISGTLNESGFRLSVALDASPVETLVESQPPGTLSTSEKQPYIFRTYP